MFEKLEKNSEAICPAILRISLLLKICYGILVQFDFSGHDLWDVSDWNTITTGNLGYIQYLYQFRCLPDFYIGQFYHPPLFYIAPLQTPAPWRLLPQRWSACRSRRWR